MKKFTMGLILLAVATAGVSGMAACSSDTVATPASSGKTIKAAEGGTISDPSGTATLTIPPGALAADTEITLSVLAASANALTSVYDFGPNGTTFKTPATLTIKAAATLAPAGRTLEIGMGAGGTFQALEGSTYANGVISAPVPHFTTFAGIAGAGGATPDAGTDAPVVGGDCAFKGTFSLSKYVCGTTDVTSQWKTVVPTETMVITDKPGGGCIMQLTHTSPNVCVEAETFEATVVSGSDYQLDHKGITSCAPASCKFVPNDAPCAAGDRVLTEKVSITADGTGFRIKRPSKVGDLCGGQDEDVTFSK